jgi:hypothetical protein
MSTTTDSTKMKKKKSGGSGLRRFHAVVLFLIGVYAFFMGLAFVVGGPMFELTGWEIFRLSEFTTAQAGASAIVFGVGLLISILTRFIGQRIGKWLVVGYGTYLLFYVARFVLTALVTTNAYIAVAPSRVDSVGTMLAEIVYKVEFTPADVLATNFDLPESVQQYRLFEQSWTGYRVPPQVHVPRMYEIGSLRSTTVAGALNPFATSDMGIVLHENGAVNTWYTDPIGFISSYRAKNYENKRIDTMNAAQRAVMVQMITNDLEAHASYGVGFLSTAFMYALVILVIILIPFGVRKIAIKKISADENGVFVFNKPLWSELFELVYYGGLSLAFLYSLISQVASHNGDLWEIGIDIVFKLGAVMLYAIFGKDAFLNSNDELRLGATSIRVRDNDLIEKDVAYDSISTVKVNTSDAILEVNGVKHKLAEMNLKHYVKQIADVAKKYYNAEVIEKSTTESAKKSDSGTSAT